MDEAEIYQSREDIQAMVRIFEGLPDFAINRALHLYRNKLLMGIGGCKTVVETNQVFFDCNKSLRVYVEAVKKRLTEIRNQQVSCVG